MATDPVPGDDTPRHSSNFGRGPSPSSGSAVSHTIHSFSKHDTIKLTESNFLLWKHQLLLILEGYDLEGFVQGTIPVSSPLVIGVDGQLVDNLVFLAHKKQDKFLAFWLLSTVSDEVLVHLTSAKSSFDIWSAIENWFGVISSIKISRMRHDLYSFKKASLSIKKYLSKVKRLNDSLIAAGSIVTEQEQVSIILAGLWLEFESVRVIASTTPMYLDLLAELLLDCEARELDLLSEVIMQANVTSYSKNSHSSKHADGYAQNFRQGHREHGRGWFRGKNRGNGRGWSRSRPQCQLCGKFGHIVQTCYHRFDDFFWCRC
ncbi:uncharacterized protein [Gossypium hirsutum]|uniref:Uncharacterized protein LOC107936195 n=1 Tax=Gossypium hirsutum TaxID=3635 RepID=A0A1U8MC06_GOSHI|nr:uncharacterized protein LOC107936195 [Gossypium hirsutum]XP_016724375.1 uncharacterized protein LOC107936195 [Gossypium hirsutum]XP_040944528.1 uncharacterized protein LOC107936195 [Gossypium hirsutum]XP_040944529.1 uncharacterized protein LOC107936195 [Gossypium hirsutum]